MEHLTKIVNGEKHIKIGFSKDSRSRIDILHNLRFIKECFPRIVQGKHLFLGELGSVVSEIY